MSLNGKVAIVTGASSGIGEAAAMEFSKAGARLVIGARRQERLDALVSRIAALGGEAIALAGSVDDEEYGHALVQAAVSSFGGLDIAFNNAGIMGAAGETAKIDAHAWHKTLQTNLTGGFYCAKHQIPAMIKRGGGSIIFTSSFVGHTVGFPNVAAYGASKAGLIGLTKCLATELGPASIRVNALLPGGTKTDMAGDFSNDPDAEHTIAGFHALKRMADADEIAKAALFLASDAASFVTGTAMLADGGNSISKV